MAVRETDHKCNERICREGYDHHSTVSLAYPPNT